MSNKEYLGGSVYAQIDSCGCVILTTENGYGASNTMILEQEVLAALQRYIATHFKQYKEKL